MLFDKTLSLCFFSFHLNKKKKNKAKYIFLSLCVNAKALGVLIINNPRFEKILSIQLDNQNKN